MYCLIQKWCLYWNVCWINTIKESKNKRLDSWGLGEILKNQMRNKHQKEFNDQRFYYKSDQVYLNL